MDKSHPHRVIVDYQIILVLAIFTIQANLISPIFRIDGGRRIFKFFYIDLSIF